MTHWADVQAQWLLENRGGPQVFATAITPSGPIHVGNMREVLTTELIFRALDDAGGDGELLYIADDSDPLRKVYPFLHESYQEYVGRPLRGIPCPDREGRPNGCGGHDSYSQHFLEPFLSNLEELGIHPTVLSATDMYQSGEYRDAVLLAARRRDAVRGIIEEVSKRQLPKHWFPFNPKCPRCGTIHDVTVLSYEEPIATIRCTCGNEERVDIGEGGAGKLPWRIDWPARWKFLGVTFEAFGKDHGAAGGSWDTGVRLMRELFGGEEPHHVMYEFLHLKGKGAMHSSTGLAVSADEVLRMTPPEVLRYLLARQSPRKHIDFDPGLGVLNLVDEFDRVERAAFGAEEAPKGVMEVERVYALSCPAGPRGSLPQQVPYRHLVTVVQIADALPDIAKILRRSGEVEPLSDYDKQHLANRVRHVRYWLANFAPDAVKFQVRREPPDASLWQPGERVIAARVADALVGVAWEGKAIHDALYAVKEEMDLKPPQVFRPVYRAILGQDRGPRAGFFLASLDKDFVLQRMRYVADA